jgi:hypothetical protein
MHSRYDGAQWRSDSIWLSMRFSLAFEFTNSRFPKGGINRFMSDSPEESPKPMQNRNAKNFISQKHRRGDEWYLECKFSRQSLVSRCIFDF